MSSVNGREKLKQYAKRWHYQHFSDNGMSEKCCLVLTAAIEVKNKSLVKRNNTATRLNDYKMSLKKWLTKQTSIKKIVFVDNSGYPLDELRGIVNKYNTYNKEVEFLSYVAESQPNVDKSHYELMQIKYALDHSQLLRGSEYFVEVSGRQFINNIDTIVKALPGSLHVIGEFSENFSYLETDIIIFNREFYQKEIFDYALKISLDTTRKDYLYLERQYARAILRSIEKDYQWYPFPYEPVMVGFGGTNNTRFLRTRRKSLWRTFIFRIYYQFNRTSFGRNRKHLMNHWHQEPRS